MAVFRDTERQHHNFHPHLATSIRMAFKPKTATASTQPWVDGISSNRNLYKYKRFMKVLFLIYNRHSFIPSSIHELHLSYSIDINLPNPPHLPTYASQTIPSHKLKRMFLKVLLQRRKSTPSILHSPRNQLPSTRTIIAKLLLIAKHLTVSIREKRQILLKLLERNLLVDDSLAHGLGHGGGHFRPGVECSRGAERLAFVLVGRGEDGANEFARVPDAVEVGVLGLRGGVAGYDPSAIGGLFGRQEGLGLVVLHEKPGE